MIPRCLGLVGAGNHGVQAHGLDSWWRGLIGLTPSRGGQGNDVVGVLATTAGTIFPHQVEDEGGDEDEGDRQYTADNNGHKGIVPYALGNGDTGRGGDTGHDGVG